MLKFDQKLLPILSVLSLSSIVLLAKVAQAQIRYSPLRIETTAEQGQARGIIEITNGGNQPFRGRLYSEPFTYNREGLLLEQSNPQDLTPFLTFSPREIVMEPGQTRRVRVVSKFLPSTPTGEYRAVFFTEGLGEVPTPGQNSVEIKPRFVIPMYVRQGNTAPNLGIAGANFNTQSRQIILLLKNIGNASTFPIAVWTLKQGQNTVNSGETKEFTMLAGGERNVAIDFIPKNQKVVPGEYQLMGDIVFGNSENPQKLSFNVGVTITPEAAAAANQVSQ